MRTQGTRERNELTMQRITFAIVFGLLAALLASPTAAQRRPGTIYDPSVGPINPIANKTARRPGDVLTVIIQETQDVQNTETSAITRDTDLALQLNNFDIKPNAFNVLPGLDGGSSDSFTGAANVTKAGSLSAIITVLVVDVLPNGNMVISGRREIRVDGETKLIEFTGIVRRFDVRADNTVMSQRVADARVVYHGTGPLSNATERRGLGAAIHDAILWLWPL